MRAWKVINLNPQTCAVIPDGVSFKQCVIVTTYFVYIFIFLYTFYVL